MKVYVCLKCKGEFKVFDGQEEAVCPECGRRVNEEKVVHYYRVIVDDDTILFETSIKEKAEKALEDYKDRRVRIKELYQEFPKNSIRKLNEVVLLIGLLIGGRLIKLRGSLVFGDRVTYCMTLKNLGCV